jgi:hypothetical protein
MWSCLKATPVDLCELIGKLNILKTEKASVIKQDILAVAWESLVQIILSYIKIYNENPHSQLNIVK